MADLSSLNKLPTRPSDNGPPVISSIPVSGKTRQEWDKNWDDILGTDKEPSAPSVPATDTKPENKEVPKDKPVKTSEAKEPTDAWLEHLVGGVNNAPQDIKDWVAQLKQVGIENIDGNWTREQIQRAANSGKFSQDHIKMLWETS